MTIASEIQRIQTNIANAYDALEAKGATMPATENTDNLVTTIDTISSGGGETVTATNNTGSAISTGDKVWINENNGSYSIEKLKELRNFKVMGNPTINDSTGIVSGFSVSNYLKYNSYPTDTINSLEILWKIRTPSSFQNYPIALILSNSTSNSDPRIQMDPNGNIYLGLSSQQVNSSSSLSTNTDYFIKIVWNNTVFEGLYSTDSINWVSCGTISLSSIVWSNLAVCIGGAETGGSNLPWLGSIYLKDCYININGVRWWEPYLLCVTENTLTGVAKENIAIGSTGDVLTLLPPEPASKKKRLVAVADNLDTNKLVLYTDDGINWNTSTMPNSRNWGHPFYGDGKFIVADYSSGIFAYSSDGINWTEVTVSLPTPSNSWRFCKGCYGNGRYIMIFNDSQANYTGWGGNSLKVTSTDGINWVYSYLPNQPFTVIDIIFDGTQFVLLGTGGEVKTSTDGETWANRTNFDANITSYSHPLTDNAFIYNTETSTYCYAMPYFSSSDTSKTEGQYIYVTKNLDSSWTRTDLNYNNVFPTASCILDSIKILCGKNGISTQSAGYINVDSTGTATFVGSSVPRLNYMGGANVINDKAVVIGYGSDQYIYSTDGTTWNTGTLPASSGWWGSCVGEVD